MSAANILSFAADCRTWQGTLGLAFRVVSCIRSMYSMCVHRFLVLSRADSQMMDVKRRSGFTSLGNKLDALLFALKLEVASGSKQQRMDSLRRYARQVICNLSDQGGT